MMTRSFSSRGVVMADWPGRRRLSWGWMSASVSLRPGGGESMMQPTALPWDSPKLATGRLVGNGGQYYAGLGTYVVTRKIWPKVDMLTVFRPQLGAEEELPGGQVLETT
jgi:hypothetical protein